MEIPTSVVPGEYDVAIGIYGFASAVRLSDNGQDYHNLAHLTVLK
jgi:hypothetical protein